MESKAQAQWFLRTAAVPLVAEPAISLLRGVTAIRVSAVVVAALLALFLIRKSRIAWTLVFIGALAQAVGGVPNNEIAEIILALVVLISILAPPSFRYVWAERSTSPVTAEPSTGGSRTSNIAHLAYAGLARVSAWEKDLTDPLEAPRSYGALLGRLFAASVLLYIVYAYLLAWENGSAHGILIVEVLAHVTLLFYLVAQAGFLFVLVLQGRSYVIRRKRQSRVEV